MADDNAPERGDNFLPPDFHDSLPSVEWIDGKLVRHPPQEGQLGFGGTHDERSTESFPSPPKQIGDLLVTLAPSEVRGLFAKYVSAHDLAQYPMVELERWLVRLPEERVRAVGEVLGFEPCVTSKDLCVWLYSVDDTVPIQHARERNGWRPRSVPRREVVERMRFDEPPTSEQLRLEIAFGVHVRPLVALTGARDGLPFDVPWRRWFDLERAIDVWKADRAARNVNRPEFRGDGHGGRDCVAMHSCITLGQTTESIVAAIARCEAAKTPPRIEFGTSNESAGIGGFILDHRHDRRLAQHTQRLQRELDRQIAFLRSVLLDALMLLNPDIPEHAVVWDPPSPARSDVTFEDLDVF